MQNEGFCLSGETMKKIFWIFFLGLLLQPLAAQQGLTADYFWLTAGRGSNTLSGETMHIAFSTQMKKHIFNVSFYMSEERLSNPFVSKNPDIFIHDISFQYGRRWMEHFGFISLSAGISLISGKDRGRFEQRIDFMRNRVYELYEIKNLTTIGIPVQMQLQVTPIKWLGLGVSVQGNINSKLPYAAFLLTGSVGRLNKGGAFW